MNTSANSPDEESLFHKDDRRFNGSADPDYKAQKLKDINAHWDESYLETGSGREALSFDSTDDLETESGRESLSFDSTDLETRSGRESLSFDSTDDLETESGRESLSFDSTDLETGSGREALSFESTDAFSQVSDDLDFSDIDPNAIEPSATTKKSARFDDTKNTTQTFERYDHNHVETGQKSQRGTIYKDHSAGSQHSAQATKQAKQACDRNKPGFARRTMNWLRGSRQ